MSSPIETSEKAKRSEMLKAVQEEAKERATKCFEKIKAVLDEYECVLVGIPRIAEDGRVMADAAVVPKA